MDKEVIKHSLMEEPFYIPMKIRKRLPIQKTIFELNEPQIKKMSRPQIPIQEQSSMMDPLVMDSTLIKSLLFGKMESYLIFLSIVVSSLIIYRYEQYIVEQTPDAHNDQGKTSMSGYQSEYHTVGSTDESSYLTDGFSSFGSKHHLLLLETFASVMLLIIMLVGIYFESQTNKTRGLQNQFSLKIIKFFIFACHPTPWTQEQNYILHLSLLLRLPFMFSYWIKTTTYHNNRSFRLTQIYGIKPSENFMFAIKSIVDQMVIREVVLIYVCIAFIFSHCLFLAGSNEKQVKPFWSCFQIVIVTLPTIGYGEYYVNNILQRGIILVAVVVGACLNSLITLIMLKQFEMSTQQTYSYDLLHKLDLKQRMEDLSRQYIIETVKQLRHTSFSASRTSAHRRQIDNNFKEQYKFLKTRYTEISTRDLNSMFTLFKEQLKEFKVKSQQMNNLLFVLLAKLHKAKFKK